MNRHRTFLADPAPTAADPAVPWRSVVTSTLILAALVVTVAIAFSLPGSIATALGGVVTGGIVITRRHPRTARRYARAGSRPPTALEGMMVSHSYVRMS